jgi:hypothetical protein
MTWVAAAVAAAGAGMNYMNSRNAGKANEKTARNNIRNQMAIQEQSDQATRGMLAELRGSNPAQYKQSIEADFVRQLMANRGTANSSFTHVPMASARYQNDVASRMASTDLDSRGMASDWATIDGAARMRTKEGQLGATLQNRIRALQRQSDGSTATSNMRIQNTQANPWVNMLGSAMQTYGTWAAGRPSGGAPAK